MNGDDIAARRREIAVACRVLAHRDAVEDILGHISLRVDDRHLLIRCRGSNESGLRFTLPEDIRLVDAASGRVVDDPEGTFSPPSELPIHTAVLAARAEVHCVVHAHPPDVVVASLAGTPFVPLFGAYNIPAMRLAEQGIALHPRSILISSEAAGDAMVESLGPSTAVVLYGHGVVTTGATVPEAVLRALHVDTLARMSLAVQRVGGVPTAIPEADRVELPDLGAGFNEITLWRHHVAALNADGRGMKENE
jgi:3,4-dihydroxyphthalate decarboxylase